MGPGEMMLVLVLALIVFGPGKLPEIARGMGRAVREFQKATSQITEELTRELQVDAPAQDPPPPQASVPQEPPQEAPVAPAEAPDAPLVLEIKRRPPTEPPLPTRKCRQLSRRPQQKPRWRNRPRWRLRRSLRGHGGPGSPGSSPRLR